MEKMIVVLDDVAYALQQLLPMRVNGEATCWILVACPPRLTRHTSRWVSRSARDAWRAKWSQELLDKVEAVLLKPGDQSRRFEAKGNLADFTQSIQREIGHARVLDARRPKLGYDAQPVTAGQPIQRDGRLTLSGGTAAMGAMLILAAE
jgi:hypothetical protein